MRVGAWEVESSAPPHKIAEALGAFADPHTGTSEMLTSEFDVRNGQEQEALASLLFSFVGVHGGSSPSQCFVGSRSQVLRLPLACSPSLALLLRLS